jgi:predicted nucleotidyltransferase
MTIDSLSPAERTAVIDLIRERIGDVIAVYLFGSRAAGTGHETSDIDIAVLARDRIPAASRWNIHNDLAEALRTDVDLIDLRSASTVMRVQVVATGALLFDGDSTARAEFEMTALSMYARLNQERQEILDQVGREGRIYG